MASFCSLSSACSQDEFVQRQNYGRAQGSTYQVYYISSPGIDHQSSIDSLFLAVDMSLSAWEPKQYFQTQQRRYFFQRDDLLLWAVMDSASLLWKDSEGLFDISMGAVIIAGVFSEDECSSNPDSALDRAMIFPSVAGTRNSPQGRQFVAERGCWWIMNGIAQGYTVDLIAQLLESRECATI